MPENQHTNKKTQVQNTESNDEGLDILVKQMIDDAKGFLEQKNYSGASGCYEIGVQFYDKSRELSLYGGIAYFNLKNFKKSSQVLKRANELSFTNQEKEEVLEYLIPSLLSVKDYQSALELSLERIKNVKREDPQKALKNAGIYYAHAFLLYKLENFDESSKYASLALQMNKDSGKTWNLLGLNFLKKSNPKAALTAFGQALKNNYSSTDLIYNLAITYARLDRKKSLLNTLATCIRKDARYRLIAKEDSEFLKFKDEPEFIKLTAPSGTTMVRRKDDTKIK